MRRLLCNTPTVFYIKYIILNILVLLGLNNKLRFEEIIYIHYWQS